MNRLGGLLQLVARNVLEQAHTGLFPQGQVVRTLQASARVASDPVKTSGDEPATEYEHATGIEKAQLEGLKKGVDIFHEEWIDKAFAGTPEDPVVVTSAYTERIVGVPDPEDDCLIIWGLIKANEPPKQLVDGGEYFVLKTVQSEPWTEIPESFKGGAHH